MAELQLLRQTAAEMGLQSLYAVAFVWDQQEKAQEERRIKREAQLQRESDSAAKT